LIEGQFRSVIGFFLLLTKGGTMTEQRGYYRFATIHGEEIVFVSEDDLWVVPAAGGVACRLTANLGAVSTPHFSGDGKWLAFVGREEGHTEVYLVSASGGPARRLTYLGSGAAVLGWREGQIVFASTAKQPFPHDFWLYTIDVESNEPQRLELGPANSVSWGPKGAAVIGRNTGDPARWKRYRGGTAGELWIDEEGSGEYRRLIELKGNLACPMWIGERVFFLSDHEGIGNIYSCLPSGEDVQPHTQHQEFYARNATTDGQRIVYHSGADLYLYDSGTDETRTVEIAYHSPHIQRSRKFADPGKYLEDYCLSHDGSRLALVHRGKTYTAGNWEGPVLQHGVRDGVRYRLTRWLKDGVRVVTVSDEGGEDRLEIHSTEDATPPKVLTLYVGRVRGIEVSPQKDEVALTNHRQELIWIDLETGTAKTIDKSKYNPIDGFGWSPDGRWIAYSISLNLRTAGIRIYDTESGQSQQATEPLLVDYAPTFDPTGKYLYFLSARIWNPVYDRLQFDLGFPKGARPYALTLCKEIPSPFVPQPRGFEPPKEEKKGAEEGKEPEAKDEKKGKEPVKVEIDFDRIQERVIPLPVEEAIYTEIAAIEGKLFYTTYPVEGALGRPWLETAPPAKAILKVYDLEKLEEAVFLSGITGYKLSGDGTAIACRIGNRLRVTQAKRDPSQELPKEEKPGRKSGWIDLARVRVSIDPASEWKQMLREAWRLQRDHFWVEDMSGVDW